MTPANFPEANANFVSPPDLNECQVRPVRAYLGPIKGGTLDGETIVVTAWTPSPDDLAQLNEGKPLFVSFIGGLPPHYPSTDFIAATNPQ